MTVEKVAKQKINEDAIKDIVTTKLEENGRGGCFVWALFCLCVLPNILNGFHVASYTLLGHLPEDQWCGVDALKATNWTVEQQRQIAQANLTTNGCTVWDWDYTRLSQMSYEDALKYTSSASQAPDEIACKTRGSYQFEAPETTFVSDWELVCDRAIDRTSAQMVLSLGKFIGSFSFGMISDKFGRKSAFTLGSVFFLVSSFFCTFSPWYWLFLVGRFGLGSASSGLFYPAFTMIVENICLKHRSWMSIAFSASYPVGMILLALAAYFIQPWRYLQLALTLPALLLILNCYLLTESPRWLISQKKYTQAYRVLFKQKCQYEVEGTHDESAAAIADKKSVEADASNAKNSPGLWTKLKEGPLKQILVLFATSKVRKLIFTSYFMFCVTSLSYYVTALNAANMSVSRFLYVGITGIVDMPSYLVPVIMLRFTGRRVTTMFLFFLTGVALLIVLALPAGSTTWIVGFAMLGRFGISATYSVVTLYTAELYPTEIRGSALGTCSTWAHVGSISAPYVVDVLGMLGWYIPTTICGCCVIVAGVLTLALPETASEKLTDCVDDVPSSSLDSPSTDSTADTSDKSSSIGGELKK